MYWAVEAGFPQTAGSILKLPQFDSPIDPVTGERIPHHGSLILIMLKVIMKPVLRILPMLH